MNLQINPQGISVIICCYNSEKRIIPTLQHLLVQVLPKSVEWELILVDNRCTDQTVEVAKQIWKDSNIPLQILYEAEPGVSRARHQGILKSRYEYIVFCDDDNHFEQDYLSKAYHLFETRTDIKMLGGQGIPLPETKPPSWFWNYTESYAAAPQGPQSGWANALYNAGMAIRRSYFLALHEIGFHFYLTSRKGNALTSGEDSELCYAYRMANWGIWYEDSMKFNHSIPAARLTWEYLVRLHKGFSASYVTHRIYESILFPERKFRPIREMLYHLAIRIKYYPKYKKAKEGDKLILHYHGWWIIARDLWHFLLSRDTKIKSIKKLKNQLESDEIQKLELTHATI
jgi:glycosyltransferase involved in cell wall biosynthesis